MSAAKRLYALDAVRRGVPVTVIARRCGVSKTTVLRWTDYGYAAFMREYLRDWKERNPAAQRRYDRKRRRHPCLSCGKPLGLGRRDGTCLACLAEEQQFKQGDIRQMWNEDHLTSPQIGERMGMTKDAVEQSILRMRRRGVKLERRR